MPHDAWRAGRGVANGKPKQNGKSLKPAKQGGSPVGAAADCSWGSRRPLLLPPPPPHQDCTGLAFCNGQGRGEWMKGRASPLSPPGAGERRRDVGE